MRCSWTTLALAATLCGAAAPPSGAATPEAVPDMAGAATDAHAEPTTAGDEGSDADPVPWDVMHPRRPRHLGLGFNVLTALGYGPLVRGRIGVIGLEVAPTLGVEYLFNRGGTACYPVVFEFPWRITFSALGWFAENEVLSHAFRLGVTANELYGWGGMVGYHLELAITNRLTLDLDTGVLIHPIGHRRVFEHLKDRCGSDVRPSISSELTNTVWLYTGVGMTLYLF